MQQRIFQVLETLIVERVDMRPLLESSELCPLGSRLLPSQLRSGSQETRTDLPSFTRSIVLTRQHEGSIHGIIIAVL